MSKITYTDLTDTAMRILNDTDYGDDCKELNADILDMGDNQLKVFCEKYIESVIAINGWKNFEDWEFELAYTLGYVGIKK